VGFRSEISRQTTRWGFDFPKSPPRRGGSSHIASSPIPSIRSFPNPRLQRYNFPSRHPRRADDLMECLNLIIQYVNDPRPARQAEFEECLRRNLANPYVKTVHNLQERADVIVPGEFAQHPKYRQHDLNRWMTYADAIGYANRTATKEVWCLLNLDIFLDAESAWEHVIPILQRNVVLCLARHEYSLDGTTWVEPFLLGMAYGSSQDAWLFQTPITINDCDFRIGTLGCDNAIAHRIKESDYVPINSCRKFRIFHLDRVRGKTMSNQVDFHAQDREGINRGESPELKGRYLVPDIDTFKSIDEMLEQLKFDEMQKYIVRCNLMNTLLKLHNTRDF
jgi:hypothetical protein